MTLSGKAQAKLLKARRLMIIGLIASVFGNYVVNAGTMLSMLASVPLRHLGLSRFLLLLL